LLNIALASTSGKLSISLPDPDGVSIFSPSPADSCLNDKILFLFLETESTKLDIDCDLS
jgi:hypothetical protein